MIKEREKKNYGNVPNDFVNEANSVQMSVRIYSHEGNLEWVRGKYILEYET